MVCRSLASFIPPTASAPPLPFSFILGLLLSFPTEGGRGIHDTPEVGLFLAGHLVNLVSFQPVPQGVFIPSRQGEDSSCLESKLDHYSPHWVTGPDTRETEAHTGLL